MNHEQIIEKALVNYDLFQVAESPPEYLPLVAKLQERLGSDKPFANVDVLFIQHHLASFIGNLNAMKASGLSPDRTWFIDIPYSTSTEVVDKLGDLDFFKHQMTDLFDEPLSNYNHAQAQRVASLMKALEEREDPCPLLVIDDGAYFVRYLNGLKDHDPDRLHHYAGTSVVEQTTRGHRYLCNEALEVISRCNLSVISIAKCRTKKIFEGPFVGAAVPRALRRAVGDARLTSAKHLAIIGSGVVGEATIRELSRICPDTKIDVVDTDPFTREKASRFSKNCEGVPHLCNNKEYDIIFGCTGYNSFHLEQRKLLADNAILASGSSAAIEFNRTGFIELADKYVDDEIEVINRQETISQGIHAAIHLRHENGKRFSFLNAGFP
ncbi:MAG: hypothetical protein KAT12_04245, partial [Gammaproteobacteria bacterium]|nr:hypothetical protein [Gammaproteobacteria bacterium]